MDEVTIQIVEQATPQLATELSRLMPQLLSHEDVVTVDKLNIVIGQTGVKLFVAVLGDKIVGTAQLSIYERVYSPMAWIDGVVVDEEVRGKGIATKLMQSILTAVQELGLPTVCLTSSPEREAANHLYQKLGFERYNTNYYRYKF